MGGPLAGTRLEIDDAVDEILVGSDPDCRLSLDLPGVSPIHARVWRDLGGITVYDTRSPMGLYVNDTRVVDQAAVRDGDVLWLGAPGEPDSVMIQCRVPEDSFLGAPVTESGYADASPQSADELVPDVADAFDAPVPEPEAPVAESAEALLGFADADPEPAAPAADDPLVMLDAPLAPPDDPFALVPEVEAPVAAMPETAPAAPQPPAPEPTPAEPAATAIAMDDDFGGDAAWGEYDAVSIPESAGVPLEIDSLLDDAPLPEPVPIEVAPAVAPAAVPVSKTGTPAPMRVPRAVIDDTRADRKSTAGPRAGVPEGVMDWARGAPAAEAEASSIPPRAAAARSARPSNRAPSRKGLLPIVGGVVLLAALAGGYFAWSSSRTPRVDSVSPPRVTAGATLTVTGANLGASAAETTATIGGRPARVTQATGDRVQVEVPELPATPGRDASVPVVVTTGGRATQPVMVAVYAAPRLKALSPDVGMPGDSVVLSGTSLGAGVTVRFGDAQAEVVGATAGGVTVRVPALPASPGTELQVVAASGADRSNALPFMIGKIPLIATLTPRSASAGDVVTVAGRGLSGDAGATRVTVGGVPALVISAGPHALEFVIPRVIAGEEMVSITVPGRGDAAQAAMSITPLPEPIGFRFFAEPFEDVPGHEHALVSTGLGPAFVLTSGQGKTAAERAVEAVKRLNDAAQVLRSTRTADIRARFDPAPALLLATRDTVLVDVAGADAEAYNEDWTHARVKGAPVTPARLAVWWEAVARDLVLLLLRGEKPQYTAALAPEGKVLGDLYDAARRSVSVGVPAAMITDKGAMRDGLRAIALRIPAGVTVPVEGAAASATAIPGVSTPPLKLAGSWTGAEMENGVRTSISVDFRGASSTLTYERALRMSVPALGVQQAPKDAVRFEVKVGAGTRYYRGRWDGSRISGKVTSDADGRSEIGTFQLEPVS
jgi:hypothetical protein